MRGFGQDLRFALRMLRKNPGFAVIAIVVLGLGIGANTAIFSVVDAIVLRPLPFSHGEELVSVMNGRLRNEDGPMSAPDFRDVRGQSRTLGQLAAFHEDGYVLTGMGEPELLQGLSASANLFEMLGEKVTLGRGFLPGEDTAGKNHVAVLSHRLWQRRFGGDPNIVGRTIMLDGESMTVIGVAQRSFRFPPRLSETDVWTPMPHGKFDRDLEGARGGHYLQVVGRLAKGVKLEQAQVEVATIQARLAAQYPSDDAARFTKVKSFQEDLIGEVRVALFVLLGAAGFVLLMACANVANLLLARAQVRQREIAIRATLGAGRGRMMRQLLTESTLLAVLGGGLGLVLALWGLDALVGAIPTDVPRPNAIAIDARVLVFTSAIALATGLVFGLVPALHATRLDLHGALKMGDRGASLGRTRARSLLLAGQIAVALLLLVGAGLSLQSFARVTRVDPGFNPHDLLTASLSLPDTRYKESSSLVGFYKDLLPRLRSLPGAQDVAVAVPLPYSQSSISLRFTLDDRSPPPAESPFVADVRMVSPDFFRVMGMRVTSGRGISAADDNENAPPTAIVSESLARTYWPGQSALGKRIRIGLHDDRLREIVGVVSDIPLRLEEASRPTAYLPFGQSPFRFFFAVVRAKSPLSLAAALRAEVRGVDPLQPVADAKTMDQMMGDSLAQRRLSTLLLGLFGALALVLAAVGIYGVMSYGVTQRSRELSIRIALGAQRGQVLRMVVGSGLKVALVGVVVGLVCSLALTRFMASLLFGISPVDPATLIGISLLLAAVAALASFLPAQRATRVDPMAALRNE